jgi:serine/threonine protein kinase
VRTDIWALGVIMFELISGRVPFDAETMPQLCGMVLSDPPPAPSQFRADLPPRLEQVILRCLEKEPSKRFQSVAELSEALAELAPVEAHSSIQRIARLAGAHDTGRRQVLDSRPPVSGGAPTALPAPQASISRASFGGTAAQKRSGPALLVLIGGALLLIGGAGVWFWLSRTPAATPATFAVQPALATTPVAVPPSTPEREPARQPPVAVPSPTPPTTASAAESESAAVPVEPAPNGKDTKKKKKPSAQRPRPQRASPNGAEPGGADPLNGRL